jgi:hypothetical protein
MGIKGILLMWLLVALTGNLLGIRCRSALYGDLGDEPIISMYCMDIQGLIFDEVMSRYITMSTNEGITEGKYVTFS